MGGLAFPPGFLCWVCLGLRGSGATVPTEQLAECFVLGARSVERLPPTLEQPAMSAMVVVVVENVPETMMAEVVEDLAALLLLLPLTGMAVVLMASFSGAF